jgi:riboflavin synthase
MFTGIVQTKSPISFLECSPKLIRYAVSLPTDLLKNLQIGASVCIHGVCQTVVEIKNNDVFFQAIEDTLKRTAIPSYKRGQLVNIERSAKMGDEIGGHQLSGHVLGTGEIIDIQSLSNEQCVMSVRVPQDWMKYILHKGYIAVNGASLTVGDVYANDGIFTLNLIPETLKITTFGAVNVGELVNIEIDSQTQAIVETVERIMSQMQLTNRSS